MFLVSSDLFCGEVCLAVVFPLCEDDGENSMGPAAGLIHVGGGHSSVGYHIPPQLEGNYTVWIY